MENTQIENNTDDKIYANQVVLSNKNKGIDNKSIPRLIYPLMKLLKVNENQIELLLKKTILYKEVICFRGSIEACETLVDDFKKLNLHSFII